MSSSQTSLLNIATAIQAVEFELTRNQPRTTAPQQLLDKSGLVEFFEWQPFFNSTKWTSNNQFTEAKVLLLLIVLEYLEDLKQELIAAGAKLGD